MAEYKAFMEEAVSLTRTVEKSFSSKKFDNKFILNLLTLALEKFMVGYLMSKNTLPEGHTLSYLVEKSSAYLPIPVRQKESIHELDEKIQLCSLEVVSPFVPDDEELSALIETLLMIQERVIDGTKV
ncbi:MAG: hypothetical protein JW801_17090 [Bacteroidales bacterium]|nr:hypothetical protein [Bacteroidales bacterium]